MVVCKGTIVECEMTCGRLMGSGQGGGIGGDVEDQR